MDKVSSFLFPLSFDRLEKDRNVNYLWIQCAKLICVSNFLVFVFSFVLSRMMVYEYVDNGNLDQWLHGDMGRVNPLTWEIQIKIIIGTAKGFCSFWRIHG
ncbi:Non-specific serine/threonine protein kinase protein [Dioscorea alata]|uniref:Non-specific serine/threonine protein kinase protein n=1 Tax=Dioscorea alata TaxID=55571 RepID=A0ACB7VAE3_DIOAL|nr:Non-specific serine/threonine protein kinase protein [Dioscorea alata]